MGPRHPPQLPYRHRRRVGVKPFSMPLESHHAPAQGGTDTDTGPQNGAKAEVNGHTCIYMDGYWIKYYEPPP
jgi:hypothetical protein